MFEACGAEFKDAFEENWLKRVFKAILHYFGVNSLLVLTANQCTELS